jgi:hypothetical protein
LARGDGKGAVKAALSLANLVPGGSSVATTLGVAAKLLGVDL